MKTLKSLPLGGMLLCFSLLLHAQEPVKEYEADVLDDATLREEIEPNQKVCFDKRIQFKARYGTREAKGCFLVNTKIGITAALPFETGPSVDCGLEVNEKKFFLLVYGMKGN